MSTDIYTIGIGVDSTPVRAAAKDLDALASAGGGAETAGKNAGSTWSRVGSQIAADVARIVKQLDEMNRQNGQVAQMLATVTSAENARTAAINAGTMATKESVTATEKSIVAAEKASASTAKAASSMTDWAGAARLAAGAIAAIGLADLVKDSALLAARYETLGIVMRVAGNNAGYTRDQMEGYAKALQASGISMLQSRESVTQLATANIDLANATKLGRAAQDLAVVGNINSSEALGRLIHGIKSGEVEILRTLGLNVSFENSYKDLAKTLGTTSNELTDQQKVIARTNAALEGAAGYAGIYEESMTTAGKALTSLTRYWEDLKTKAGEAFLPTLAEGVFTLTGGLKDANAELDTMSRPGGLLEGTGSGFKAVFDFALNAAAGLAAELRIVGNTLGAIAATGAALTTRVNTGTSETYKDALTTLFTSPSKFFKDAATDAKQLASNIGEIWKAADESSAATAATLTNFVDRTDAAKTATKAAVGMSEEQRIAAGAASRAEKEAQDASQKAAEARTKFTQQFGTDTEKASEAVAKWKKTLGSAFTAADERAITEKFTHAGAAASKAQKSLNRELEQQEKLLAEINGLSPTFYKDWDLLTLMFERGALSVEELTEQQKKLLEKQPGIRKEIEATAKVMKAQYADQVEFAEDVAKAEVEMSKAREAGRLAVDAYARSIDESNDYVKFEQGLAGKSERDRDIAIEQYRVQLELKKQLRDIDSNAGYNEEQRVAERLRVTEIAARASAGIIDKVTLDEWKKTTAAIESSLTDALLRGFESGKGFGKNLRDTLFNLFRTLVLRPIISAIISPVSGTISGVVNNILGTAGSGVGGIGNLFNMASSANSLYGFYSGNSMAGNLYAGAANVYNGGSFAAGYSAAGSAPAGAANAVSGLDIAGAGYSGTATAGGGGSIFGGAGGSLAGLGYAAAAYVALLAAVGAFAQTKPTNFGIQGSIGETGEDNNLSGYTVYRTGGSLFNGPSYSSMQTPLDAGVSTGIQATIAALFSSTRGFASVLGLDPSRLDGFTSTFGNQVLHPDFRFNSGIDGAITGSRTNGILNADGTMSPGVPTWGGGGGSTDERLIGLDLTGKTPEEQKKLIAEAIKKYNDDLANQIFGFYEEVTRTVVETIGYGQQYLSDANGDNGYFADNLNDPITQTRVETGRVFKDNENSKYIHQGESAGDALARLATSLQTVNGVLSAFGGTVESVGNRLFKASLAGADMASQLVDLFGGLDKFNETTMAYFGAYYTQAEQEGVAREQLAASFRAINVAMPESNAAFRALVESQDLTTDGGRRTYASLLQLSGAFAALYPLVDDATDALQDAEAARDAAFAALQSAIEARQAQLAQERDAVAATVANLQSLFDYLRAASHELYAEVSSTRAAAGNDGRALIAAAAAGGPLPDRDVLAQAVTDARATMGEENYVSRTDADRDRLVLAGQLETIGDAAGAQLTTAEQTLASLDRQIQQLDQTLNYWKQQVDAANGNLDATISVEEAIRALQALMFPSTATGPQGAMGKNPALVTSGSEFSGGGAPASAGLGTAGGFVRETNIGAGFFGVAVTDPAEIARLTSINAIIQSNASSVTDALNAVRAAGGSLSDVQAATGYHYEDILAAAARAGVPAFAVGTNYVPQDMLAVVHKGEAIIPAAYNSENSAIADRLDAVVAELREVKARQVEGNAQAQRTANAVNGRGEAPQLVEMAQ